MELEENGEDKLDRNVDKSRSTENSQCDGVLLETIQNRRGKMVGHLIHIYDSFIKNIMEGKVEGSRGRGRPKGKSL